MAFTLSNLQSAKGARTRSKRMGRGPGSGRGKTAGRGTKGQRSRTGGRRGLARIGLKRIMQRIPKHRGFTSLYKKQAVVNVGVLEKVFSAGTVVTPELLKSRDIIGNRRHGVKVLGEGVITKALTIRGCEVSKSAKEKIEKVGGKIL